MNNLKKIQNELNNWVVDLQNNQLDYFIKLRKFIKPTKSELIKFKKLLHHPTQTKKIFNGWLIRAYQNILSLKNNQAQNVDDFLNLILVSSLNNYPNFVNFLATNPFFETIYNFIYQKNNININHIARQYNTPQNQLFLKFYQKLSFSKITLKQIHLNADETTTQQLIDLYAYHLKYFDNNQIVKIIQLTYQKKQSSRIHLKKEERIN